MLFFISDEHPNCGICGSPENEEEQEEEACKNIIREVYISLWFLITPFMLQMSHSSTKISCFLLKQAFYCISHTSLCYLALSSTGDRVYVFSSQL